jgi:hypothetical protein
MIMGLPRYFQGYMMKPSKKFQQTSLIEIKVIVEEQNIQLDNKNIPEVITEAEQVINLSQRAESYYIPARYNPIIQSVGKSGWEISDIWRDIRVDNFSDYD